MKTKTVAVSLMLTFTSCALFAQTDTLPKKDSIPKTDSIPKKKSSVTINPNVNENLTAFNFSTIVKNDTVPGRKDSIPIPADSIPKKDSTASLNSSKNLDSGLSMTIEKASGGNSLLKDAMKSEGAYIFSKTKRYKVS